MSFFKPNDPRVMERVTESHYTQVHKPTVTVTTSSKNYVDGTAHDTTMVTEGGVTRVVQDNTSSIPNSAGMFTNSNRQANWSSPTTHTVHNMTTHTVPNMTTHTVPNMTTHTVHGPTFTGSNMMTYSTSSPNYSGPITHPVSYDAVGGVTYTEMPKARYGAPIRNEVVLKTPGARFDHIDDTASGSRVVSHTYQSGPTPNRNISATRYRTERNISAGGSAINHVGSSYRTTSHSSIRNRSIPMSQSSIRNRSIPSHQVSVMEGKSGNMSLLEGKMSGISPMMLDDNQAESYKKVTVNGQVIHEQHKMTNNGQELINYEYTDPNTSDLGPIALTPGIPAHLQGGREVIEKSSAKYINGQLVDDRKFLQEDGKVVIDTYYN